MPEEEYVPPKRARRKADLPELEEIKAERPGTAAAQPAEPPSERDKQDAQFTQIVEAFKSYYQKKSADNHTYKKIFFYLTMLILLVIAAGFVAVCVCLVWAAKWQIAVPIAGAGAAAIVTALLKLPEIIATHLFPLKEDQVIVDLVKALKDTDNPARTAYRQKTRR